MKRKLAIGVVVSGLFLFLAMRGIDWTDFAAAFKQANYLYLIPAVVFTMLGHYSRAHRWGHMIHPIQRVRIGPLWSATAVAFMVNNLFPARVGEFVRAYAIGKSENISKSASFATIVYERIVDVFVLIFLLWYCLVAIDGPEWISRSAFALIVFNVVLLTVLVMMVRYRGGFNVTLRFFTRHLPERISQRIEWWADAFVDGLGVVTNMRALTPIVIYSIGVWGCAVLGAYYCVLALGMDLPVQASLFLIAVISLGSMIPSAPAFLGTMQYACVIGLSVYGVDKSHALAYSTVYHGTQFFPITAAGLYYAWASHIRLRDISAGNQEAR